MTKARVEIACQLVATYEDGRITGWTVSPWGSYAGFMGKVAEVLSGDEGLDVEDTDGPFWRAVQHHLSMTGETGGGALAVEWEEDGPSEIPATGDEATEDGEMTTTIKWERGVAGQVAAHLLSDDGGHALVHCMLPGGKPRFMARPDAQEDTSIVDAPACDTFKAFQRFVTERFGDKATGEAGHANHASAAILLAVAGVLATGAWQVLEQAVGMLGGVG